MTIKELYEAIGGNYETALNTMMMDDFIRKMLGKFVENNSFSSIVDGYQNKDYKKVFEASHNFKGVTGNLALTSLYNKTLPIVEPTRNFSNITDLNLDNEIAELKKEYEHVVSLIKQVL